MSTGNPECFGNVTRSRECNGCAVKMECYEQQQTDLAVYLLPKDRPAPKDAPPKPARYVKETPTPKVNDAADQEDE